LIYLLFIRLITVRTGGLQVVLIELYSVLSMWVQHVDGHHEDWAIKSGHDWDWAIKIIKSGQNWKWETLPRGLFLPQAALKEGSDEEKLSLIWHLWRGQ